MRRRIFVAASAVLTLFALSCLNEGPDKSVPTAPLAAKGGPKLKSISVSPNMSNIVVGQTVQLTASATPGSVHPTYAWNSSNSSVATVSSNGLVTGIGTGTATITASESGISGSATVAVTVPQPTDPVLVGAGDIAS